MHVIDISPDTHVIHSMQNQGMEAWKAFAEFVDNSLDAEATLIVISLNKTEITITDNGIGVADLTTLAKLGSHRPEGRSTSGRYGIGAKESALALGEAFSVTSIRNHFKSSIFVDFNKMKTSGKWEALGQGPEPAGKQNSGTVITISQLKETFYKKCAGKHLSEIFAPALKQGKKILFFDQRLTPTPEESISGKVGGSGEFNGKQYQWHAGISGKSSKNTGGWTVALKHRIIKTGLLDGIPEHYLASKFYGYIELMEKKGGPKWTPTKHKDNVEELEELCKELFPEVQHLLEKCTEESELVFNSNLQDFLTNCILDPEQESRNKKSKHPGRSKPTGEGGPRTTATKTKPGKGVIPSKKTGAKVTLQFDKSSKMFINVVGRKDYKKVIIGMLHPFWKKKTYTQEEVFKIMALSAILADLVTSDEEGHPLMFLLKKEEEKSPHDKWFSLLNHFSENMGPP